jgi:hypothetical protein
MTGNPLQTRRICHSALSGGQLSRSRLHFQCLLLLTTITLLAPRISRAQQTETVPLPDPAPAAALPAPTPVLEAVDTDAADHNPPASNTASQQSSQDAQPPVTTQIRIEPSKSPKLPRRSPESEIAVEGMVSYGNWQIFAAGINEHLYTAGFEYDRHSWGEFIGAQMDYAADFTPLVLLKEPAILNPYGVQRSKNGDFVTLHGLAFSPIGLRMEWRPEKKFKPYFTVMGGGIAFTKKALSPDASYFDFTLHESIGFYLQMSKRVDMRFGLFGDFHFSNAYITAYNPGLDNMNSELAVSYHFGG